MDDLLDALDEYFDARREHDAAKEKADLGRWGYYGERFCSEVRMTRNVFEIRLKRMITDQVNEILANRGLIPQPEATDEELYGV